MSTGCRLALWLACRAELRSALVRCSTDNPCGPLGCLERGLGVRLGMMLLLLFQCVAGADRMSRERLQRTRLPVFRHALLTSRRVAVPAWDTQGILTNPRSGPITHRAPASAHSGMVARMSCSS